MRVIYPILFAIIIVAVFGLIEILLIRTLSKNWWKYRPIKYAAIFLPIIGVIAIICWYAGVTQQIEWLYQIGATVTAATLVLLLALMLSLPFSGVLHTVNRWLEKRRAHKTSEEINEKRRAILKGSAAALPILTLSLASGGIAGSFSSTNVYLRKIAFPGLPKQLEGLKILQLTDSHLGIYKQPVHIEELLADAASLRPDLILLTGDIADDLALLSGTLKMISEFNAPLGAFGILGNHEYYRGVTEVKKIYANSPIPLMIGEGRVIDIDGAILYLAGADDPRTMHGNVLPILETTIDKAVADAPSGSFKILMSHRPEGFDFAARRGIDLTLAGHTHGGQMGLSGRSFFESFMPERYLWGMYREGVSQMYVSAGIGHWFPFRLGCPPEAPIIELTSK